MLHKIENQNMGKNNLGWLNTNYHFSFADYYNPNNMNFGALRVLNDDIVAPETGFDTHPHRDMEIITYVIEGALTHQDSMGNKSTITRGHVQYMSAGTGVFHSEHNLGPDPLRLLQVWMIPDQKGYSPNYGDLRFAWTDRKNHWLQVASGKKGAAPIQINQDANFYVLELEKGRTIEFPVKKARQAYLVQIEGASSINHIQLDTRDALEITEEDISISAIETSHFLMIEMKKDV